MRLVTERPCRDSESAKQLNSLSLRALLPLPIAPARLLEDSLLFVAEHFKADGIVIVTDFRQSDHFEQLFLTLKKCAVCGCRCSRRQSWSA